MTTGLSMDLQDISDARKTAVINSELLKLQVVITALQETHLAETGSLREQDFTFFWRGKAADKTREYGIGFAVKKGQRGSSPYVFTQQTGLSASSASTLHTHCSRGTFPRA